MIARLLQLADAVAPPPPSMTPMTDEALVREAMAEGYCPDCAEIDLETIGVIGFIHRVRCPNCGSLFLVPHLGKPGILARRLN